MGKVKEHYSKLKTNEQSLLTREKIEQSLKRDLVLYLGKVYTQEAFAAKSLSMRHKPFSCSIRACDAGLLFDTVYTVEDVLNGIDEQQIEFIKH